MSNEDQVDQDFDGLGDACDREPTIKNFSLGGQFLSVGSQQAVVEDSDQTESFNEDFRLLSVVTP